MRQGGVQPFPNRRQQQRCNVVADNVGDMVHHGACDDRTHVLQHGGGQAWCQRGGHRIGQNTC